MKVYKWCVAVLLCLLCLTGCGKREVPDGEENTEVPEYDWKTNGFAVSGEVQDKQALWASDYIEWEHENGYYRVLTESAHGKVYRIHQTVSQEEGGEDRKRRYWLEIFDTSAMQTSVTEIDSEKLGINNGSISGIGFVGPGNYVFRVEERELPEEGWAEESTLKLLNHYLVYSDLEENTQKVDLLSVYQELGIANKVYSYECICDAAGNSYTRVMSGDSLSSFRDLYILDREGNLLMEHRGDALDEIMKPLEMREGELIFPVYNNREKNVKFIWFDLENKEERTVAVFEPEARKPILQVYGIQGNDIYYESLDGIVVWNIASGDRQLVYSFDENGVTRIFQTMLVFREGKPPVLRMRATVNSEEEDWLVALSDQEIERPDATRIVSLLKTSSRVQNCVAAVSRRNPGQNFTYEDFGEAEREDMRTRVIAEMVAGGGPDILYVSVEDMKLLKSRGLIKDLRELLPQEAVDRILPGIIDLGTVEGTFVGLAPEMECSTVVTLKSIWNRDTWKLEDILMLLDTGNYSGIFCQDTTSFAPGAVLGQLTMAGLLGSSLVDWEKGESHFESELFLRILEASTTYGDDPIRMDTWLGEGGCLGNIVLVDLEIIEELHEQYGEDFYFVGEPADGSCGNYLRSNNNGVLVVNSNISDSKAVSTYLEYLLTDEIQYPRLDLKPYASILKVFPEDVSTAYDLFTGEKRLFWKGKLLKIKDDGTTYLNEYKEFLESCVPEPREYDDLMNLMWAEAQSYINGDKSAKDVAQVIDNIIQLYLDERN